MTLYLHNQPSLFPIGHQVHSPVPEATHTGTPHLSRPARECSLETSYGSLRRVQTSLPCPKGEIERFYFAHTS